MNTHYGARSKEINDAKATLDVTGVNATDDTSVAGALTIKTQAETDLATAQGQLATLQAATAAAQAEVTALEVRITNADAQIASLKALIEGALTD